MKIEHVAFNVEDPRAVSAWYVENLGLTVVRRIDDARNIHFLADRSGQILLEFYGNPAAPVLPYAAMQALSLHVAFVSDDPAADTQRLLAAGAAFDSEETLPDGSQLVMLRDPWGLAIQFCNRRRPLLGATTPGNRT